MPTKIINVLKDDSFEDILGIFNEASANEVIFILPKKHVALSDESHFVELAEASKETGKSVLILASSPTVNSLALKYNLGILTNEKTSRPPKAVKATPAQRSKQPSEAEQWSHDRGRMTATPVLQEEDEQELLESQPEKTPVEPSDELAIEEDSDLDNDQEVAEDDGGTPTTFEAEVIDFPEVELAAVKRQSKSMSDIIEPPAEDERVKVNVSTKSDRPLNVEVKKEKKAIRDNIEDVWHSRVVRPEQQAKVFSLRPRLPFLNLGRKTITFLGAGVVVLFLAAIYISTGSANIIIKPRSQDLDFSIKVTASDLFSTVDVELKKIPGQLFSVNKKVEETFQATGERDVAQKAKGKITVYNEYGTTPQTLIATTRFESEKGLVFRTLKTITVPGTTVKNGVITPGKIEVEVIADKAGDSYNIGSGKFTVMAFKEKGDTDRYNKFYGMSTEPMKGGIVGKAKVVTDKDYIDGKESVSKKLFSEMENELRSQASGLKILTSSTPDVKELTSTAQPDEASDTFVISESAELKAVGFKESDLYNLIGMYISNLNNLMILPEKLTLEFKDVKFNKEQGSLEFTVAVKGPAYGKIEKDKMVSDLIGKNEEAIKDYIKGIEGISSAKVVLSPFWVKRVPTNREKIKFEIQY